MKDLGDSHIKVTGMLVVSLRPCKLQILVSLGVFGKESHYILPIQVTLRALHKKFTKNAMKSVFSMLSFRGQFKL